MFPFLDAPFVIENGLVKRRYRRTIAQGVRSASSWDPEGDAARTRTAGAGVAVAIAWAWVGAQSYRSKRRPARSTTVAMVAATIFMIAAFLVEPVAFRLLGSW